MARTPVVFVTDSIGNKVQGRTRAMLLRAAGLADCGHEVYIATWNIKAGYDQVFERACSSLGIRGLRFLNLYQFFSECDLYGAGEDGSGAGETCDDGDPRVRLHLDKQGDVLREMRLAPDCETPLETVARVPGSQRAYLVLRHGKAGTVSRALWLRKDGGAHTFDSERELYAFWFAGIARGLPERPVFVSEQHDHDDALLSNPFAEQPLAVIAMANSMIYKAPYEFGAKLNAQRSVIRKLSRYDAVVAPTEGLAADLARLAGCRESIRCIPCAAEPLPPGEKPARKQKWALALFCESKRAALLEDALRAFAAVHERRKRATLDLYGVDKLTAELDDLADRLGVRKALTLHGSSAIAAAEVSRYRLLFSTSKYASLNLGLLQALEQGVPVVAYDCDFGPRELVVPGVTGELVDVGDVEGLVAALRKVLLHPHALRKGRAEAVSLRARYAPEAVTAQWETLVEEVADGRSTPEALVPEVLEGARLFHTGRAGELLLAARPAGKAGARLGYAAADRPKAYSWVPATQVLHEDGWDYALFDLSQPGDATDEDAEDDAAGSEAAELESYEDAGEATGGDAEEAETAEPGAEVGQGAGDPRASESWSLRTYEDARAVTYTLRMREGHEMSPAEHGALAVLCDGRADGEGGTR